MLVRPGMTPEKLVAIRSRQMPDAEKLARADFIIDTGLPLNETKAEVDHLLESLKNRAGEKIRLWRELYEDGAGGGQTGS